MQDNFSDKQAATSGAAGLVQIGGTPSQATGKTYWRSLNELTNRPEFRDWVEREFPSTAAQMLDGASRRNVLKLMAASFGLAGLTACRRPVENILPYSRQSEGFVHGKPLYYATAMAHGGAATGLLVEVNEGRPTKVEGLPEHPYSLGAANVFHQGSLLSLYDPDRLRGVRREGRNARWEEFASFVSQEFHQPRLGSGDRLRILSERVISPSLHAVRDHALAAFPNAKWIEYDAVETLENCSAAQAVFGPGVVPRFHYDKADVIVSLDADFLGLDSPTVLSSKQFARRRRVSSEKDGMNRLYVVESQLSTTGAAADHRLRMRSSEVVELARALAAAVAGLSASGPHAKVAAVIAKDLNAHRGRSLVVAGPRQPAEVHALAYAVNQALGNIGQTVTFVQGPAGGNARPQLEALRALAGEMSRGEVERLVILGGNPVYTAPADLEFAANLKKVRNSIYLGQEYDETAAVSKWAVPEAHYLESWGDATAPDGTVSLQQPAIQPLHGGKTQAELIALIANYKDQRGHDILRNYWTAKLGGEKAWLQALHDGMVPNTAYPAATVSVDTKRFVSGTPSTTGVEVVFVPSAKTWDGRYANNGWLQELPEPITKLTWDNAALLSPATARQLGAAQGDLISIERDGRSLNAPVLVQPGQADNSITIALGYGRAQVGRVGKGAGVNAYKIRTTDAWHCGTGFTVRKTGGSYELVQTQEHQSMEGRPLVREATLEEYRREPNFAREAVEAPPLVSLYGDHDYSRGNQWGMAIDLSACTGCSACIVACQAENNIPIVGKDQVSRGREMLWLRVDRYYSGSEEDPQAVSQPVPCMQCENAPCENVCPVAATAHSPEGLNDMAYNRCVGTRYCSNNCPFKVRRFNFFNWHYGTAEVQKMAFNPDVTVRMRGVMEKCTYCVQRIQEKKIEAKAQGRRDLKDGEIQTACQQTCPSEAILFGNINDPNSRVARVKKQNRNYAMLEELNIRPRTTYLAKLRNPNPELEAQHG
ncbi:MAG: TAT-variant-translocated molybdopterin oxidoreductase [Acidobacteria bacterium]|nr:TAT-variant-translocated molybdopterin oxidoreductase [Acidobacteriota bacterium]